MLVVASVNFSFLVVLSSVVDETLIVYLVASVAVVSGDEMVLV